MAVIDSPLPRKAESARLPQHDKILIVDFGSQVTQLIARRVREEKVYCEIVPFQKAEAALAAMRPKGVILSGGPASVLDVDAPLAPTALYDAGIPVLGICYGEQAMAMQLGGRVEGGHHREFGRAEVLVTAESPLLDGTWRKGERYPVWMSHGDRVTRLPEGFRTIATSPNAPIAMIADEQRRSTPRNSTSKWCTRRTARRSCAISCARWPAAAAIGPCAPSRRRQSRR